MLGIVLAAKGRHEKAARHLEQAVELSGGREPGLLDLLGRDYAELGRFPAAAQIEIRALAAATQRNSHSLAAVPKARIALYEAGRKY